MKWKVIKTAWVTLINLGLASAFVFFLFDIWTETSIVERVLIQGAQVLVAAALIMGVALEFRRSGMAWKWNVAAQVAAAMFPCACFCKYCIRRVETASEWMESRLCWSCTGFGYWPGAASRGSCTGTTTEVSPQTLSGGSWR